MQPPIPQPLPPGTLAPAAEYAFRGNLVAVTGTATLGMVTNLAQRRFMALVQFTGQIVRRPPNAQFRFRREATAGIYQRNAAPPNNVVVLMAPAPHCDDSFAQNPQPGGPTWDYCANAAAPGIAAIQDRTPSGTNRIYDADSPGTPGLAPTPVGTIFAFKASFTQWVECRHGGGNWHRVSGVIPWYTRHTIISVAGGYQRTNAPIPAAGIGIGNTGPGTAGLAFPFPFPIVPGSVQVSVGGNQIPANEFTVINDVIVQLLANQPAGQPITIDCQRPAFNDFGRGLIDVRF